MKCIVDVDKKSIKGSTWRISKKPELITAPGRAIPRPVKLKIKLRVKILFKSLQTLAPVEINLIEPFYIG